MNEYDSNRILDLTKKLITFQQIKSKKQTVIF